MQIETLLKRNPVFQWVAVLLAMFATAFAAYQSITGLHQQRIKEELARLQVEKLRMKFTSISETLQPAVEDDIRRFIEEQAHSLKENADLKELRLQIESLQKQTSRTAKQTLGLRQSINPENPEEILTIARLGDQIEALQDDFEEFETRTVTRATEFHQSVVREIEASNSATNLIIVALIPLVLNLVYTIWKDTRRARAVKDETTPAQKS